MTSPALLSAATFDFWHGSGPLAARSLEQAHPVLVGSPAWFTFQGKIAEQFPRDSEMCALLGVPLTPPVVGLPAPEFVPRDQRGHDPALALKDVDLGLWKAVKPASMSTLREQRIHNGDMFLLSYPKSDIALRDFLAENLLLEDVRQWCKRGYRQQKNVIFRRCTLKNARNEHGDYDNLAGYNGDPALGDPDTTFARRWVGCMFVDLGGQGQQMVLEEQRDLSDPVEAWLRINEANGHYDEDCTPGGWLSSESNSFINVGCNRTWGRASYCQSFFSTRNHVRVCHDLIDASMQQTARGALLIEGVPAYTDVRGVSHPRFPRRAIVENYEVRGRNYDRPPVKIQRSMEDLVIRDSLFDCIGGQRDLLIASDTRKVSVTGCQGPGRLIDENGKVLETVVNGYQRG